MAQDGFIQAPPDSTGKPVDTTEKQNFAGQTVERLRLAAPDTVVVSGDALDLILSEMRITSLLVAQAFGLNDLLDQLRSDVATGAL